MLEGRCIPESIPRISLSTFDEKGVSGGDELVRVSIIAGMIYVLHSL